MNDNADSCYPQQGGPEQVEGGTITQLCHAALGFNEPLCAVQHRQCIALSDAAGPPLCIDQTGDVACPEGWPKRHLLFYSNEICGCRCGEPMGASCSTTVTVHEDGACGAPLASVTVYSDGPTCGDLPPGTKIGSQSATVPTYTAGLCTPKAYEPTTTTLCCMR